MPVLPSSVTDKGKHALGQADIAVPDELITARDQDEWAYYAACLPPSRLIAKLSEALDLFHRAYHESQSHLEALSLPEKNRLLSRWNAASILATQIIERFQFEETESPTAYKDAVSESLFYLNHFLTRTGAPSAEEWRNRADYYNEIDAMLMQDIANESFERLSRNCVRQGQGRQPAP